MKKKRKIISILMCVTILVTLLVPNYKIIQAATKKMSISKTSVTMDYDEEYVISIKNPTQKVKWSSSNKKLATIKTFSSKNSKCKIIAHKKGKVTITAKVGKKKFKCKVKIEYVEDDYYPEEETPTPKPTLKPTSNPVPVPAPIETPTPEPTMTSTPESNKKGYLNKDSVKLNFLENETLSLVNATAKTWTSSDNKVVLVENGTLIPKCAGSAIITCTDTNGYSYFANVEIYYPDIKFSYDKTIREFSKYYFDCYNIQNNSKYDITFSKDKYMNQKGAWEYLYINGLSDNNDNFYIYTLFSNTGLNGGKEITPSNPFTVNAGETSTVYAFSGTKYPKFTANSEIIWTIDINNKTYVISTSVSTTEILAMIEV